MRSTFTFNGHKCDEFGIYISKKPQLNRSQRKFQSASVAGRNGNIYQFQDAWDEVVVTYDIFAGGYEQGDAPRDFTAIMEWLNSADDYARLEDSFDEDHYRMAVFVDATNIEQKWYSTGQAQIKFRCKPQHYLVGEVVSVEDGDTITNPTNHTALPIITLTGEGASSLLDLEKISPSFNFAGSWILQREFLNWFGATYVGTTVDGVFTTVSMFTDEYAISSNDIRIMSRDNVSGQISFQQLSASKYGVGTGMTVLADTEYTISASANKAFEVCVIFVSDSNNIFSSKVNAFSENDSISFTFKTPTDCTRIMLIFYATDITAITITDIMLVMGAEAQPFKPYEADTSETITINDTTLKIMLNGFGEAVIDCERENFSVDGADNNIGISVLDQYGNLSVDYLKLDKGENQISFSEGITSVSVDCRFWEL